MHSNLYLKFIILYIIFGFLSLFTAATLGAQLILDTIRDEDASRLYREATILATDYLTDYYSKETTASSTRAMLSKCLSGSGSLAYGYRGKCIIVRFLLRLRHSSGADP